MLRAMPTFNPDNPTFRALVGAIFATHLAASAVTVLNTTSNGCRASLPLLVLLTVAVTVALVIAIRRGDFSSSSLRQRGPSSRSGGDSSSNTVLTM